MNLHNGAMLVHLKWRWVMITFVNSYNVGVHGQAMDVMFKDRKRVFVDLLKWSVPVRGEYEQDQFDDEEAEYVIICDPQTGDHQASMRILRTDRPHLLNTVFPTLCEAELPEGPEYRELTRLCISPRLRFRDRLTARNRLFTTLVEYALLAGIKGYTGVSEMRVYSQVLALGWRCSPLGLPQEINGELVAAILAHVEPETINLFREAGTYDSGEIVFSDTFAKAA